MPVLPCQKDGKKGFKWGKNGVCITESKDGKSPKERAAAVGRAIQAQRFEAKKDLKVGTDVGGAFLVPFGQKQIDLLDLSPATVMGLDASELEDFHDRLHRLAAQIGRKDSIDTDKGQIGRKEIENAHRILEQVVAERNINGIIAQKDPLRQLKLRKNERATIIVMKEQIQTAAKTLLSAYFLHLEKYGYDLPLGLPKKEVVAEKENEKLYRLTDGYGEWYFKENDKGFFWVAQKMPDVSAYSVTQALAEDGFDQKVEDLGWGDKAWDSALAEWFTAEKSEGKEMATEKRDAGLLKFIAELGKQAEGVQFVIGRLKGETTTTVQSVLFDKENWTLARAKAWLKENDFKSGNLDETEDKYRFRQREPGDFQDRSFRTIDAGDQKVLEKAMFPVNVRGWTVGQTFEIIQEAGGKLSQDEANYIEPSNNSAQVCGDCRFFLRDETGAIGTCQVVRGPVAWFGTSDLYINAGAEAAAAFASQEENGAYTKTKGDSVERIVPIIKTGDPGFILAPVLVPEEPDFEGDVISSEEIERAAHDFMEHFQNVGLMHQQILQSKDVVLVESSILRSDAKVNGTKLKKGTWVAAFRIHNPQLKEAVKDGKITGVSIGGIGQRTEEK